MIHLTRQIDSGAPCSTLTLDYEQRIKSRLRVKLGDGREAGLFLERGTVLRDGDLLASDDGICVRVKAASEPVSTAATNSPLLLAQACYHLGNRHVAVEIGKEWVRYRPDHVLDHMLEHLGLTVRREEAPFVPETGAYHSHGHGHD